MHGFLDVPGTRFNERIATMYREKTGRSKLIYNFNIFKSFNFNTCTVLYICKTQ